MLHFIVLLPLLAAIAILVGAPARRTALAAGVGQLLFSLFALLNYQHGGPQFQWVSSFPVVAEWKINYALGADGLSLLMLLLTALVTAAAVWATPPITRREPLFYACLLFISAGAAGAFAAVDLFFFYAFHELALIPTFLLIGLWGHGERFKAAWKITLYLGFGSFVLLIGLTDLYFALPEPARTFNMMDLQRAQGLIPALAQSRPYLFLLVGFGTLISLFPFHSWAPQAYAAAPAPAAMLHAGVLKKFGLYGLIRLALPLLPDAARQWAGLLLILLVGNIIYVGLVVIAQKKLDRMLGTSSVMHMGYIFLGIASLNVIGVSGAALLMFAHGLSIAALFAMAGVLREKSPTLSFESFSGLAKPLPWLAFVFGLAAFASIGLPGFANFAGELPIFFGAFRPAEGLNASHFQLATVFALWGVVISAVYMLRAYRTIFMGPPHAASSTWSDPRFATRAAITTLVAVLLLAGFFPGAVLGYLRPSIEALLPR